MLKERINILKSAEVISEQTANYVCTVIDELEEMFAEKVSEMEMFTTQLILQWQHSARLIWRK